jgi:ketosteroid isomerase-like protein
MSEENVELARQALEALGRRDLELWLAVHDEDFEVVPIRDWPEPGVRGPEAAWDFYLKIIDLFADFPADQAEVTDAGGERVVAHPRYEVRGRESGAGVEFEYWVVFTFRRGRILRAEWFADRAEALEAAGLSE